MPPPQVVANIASIEATADADSYDVEKQVALFEALLATDVKAGRDVLISRWERACAFVSQSKRNLDMQRRKQTASHQLCLVHSFRLE